MTAPKPTHVRNCLLYEVWPCFSILTQKTFRCANCESVGDNPYYQNCPRCAPSEWEAIDEKPSVWWARNLDTYLEHVRKWRRAEGFHVTGSFDKPSYRSEWEAIGWQFHFGPTPPEEYTDGKIDRAEQKGDARVETPLKPGGHLARPLTQDQLHFRGHLPGCHASAFTNYNRCSCNVAEDILEQGHYRTKDGEDVYWTERIDIRDREPPDYSTWFQEEWD